jgi:histone H3/H4
MSSKNIIPAPRAAPFTATAPRIRKSKWLKEKMFAARVNKLSSMDLRELVQWQPFQRLVKSKLCHDVTRASSPATLQIAEAALSYLHELYTDAFNVTDGSGKRRTLMVRDVLVTVDAKRGSIVSANDAT